MATYDYKRMKEHSEDPEVKDLYHSSATNFPDPIMVNPQMWEQFNRDAARSLETQGKVLASVVSGPAAGSGVLANAALGGVIGAVNSQGDSAWGVTKSAAVGAAIGGAAASAAPVFNQVRNWAGHGPKLVIGIGENGARNLGSAAAKLPSAQVLPGETSGLHIMQAPLTTRGRVLTGQGTALDRAVIKIKDHSIVKAASENIKGLTMSPEQRFGDLIGGTEGRLFKQAYPVGSKTPVIQLDPLKADKSIIDFSEAAGHYEPPSWTSGEQIVVASPNRVGNTASILSHEGKHMLEVREPLIQASVISPNRTSVKPTVPDRGTGGISRVSLKRPVMEQPNASENFVDEVLGRTPTLERGAMFSVRQVLNKPEYYSNGGEHGARIFNAMQETGTTDAGKILGSVRTRAKYKLTKDPANISGQRNTMAELPEDQMAAKAGQAGDPPRRADLSNFLATDEVPETLFGIPIVASPEQYTEADIAFFKEHPRAGGFYELGDEDTDTQAAEGAEGASEEPPRYYKVQPGDNLSKISKATGVPYANIAKYSKLADPNKIRVGQVLLLTEPYPGKWNNPGNVRWNRKVVREGETGKVKSKVSDGYFLTFDTPQNGLNAQAQVIGAIARSTIPERYQKGELPNSKFTISNLINVYAPPNDKNDTSGYIKFVADELGVDKDAELNIDDAKQMSSLLRAIVTRDSKSEYAEWFRDSEYAEAVKKMKTPVKGREEPGKKGK